MDRFEDAKLRIKEATDLVALIESYLPLRPRGRTLVALCPFHAESTPSFTVHRENQFYRCYGCGKTGDAFSWLMERDGMTFREAMEVLAERVGVSLEGVFQKGGRGAGKAPGRDAYAALAAVADFLHKSLLVPEGRPARDYLEARGLDEAIVPWQLGYHPAGQHQGARALHRFAREQQLPQSVLEEAGLIRNGREAFAGRLMFPILDERGRTVAFGGRVVPGAPGSETRGDYTPPKYINSPESPFFSKRRVLFGLHRAKQAGQRRLVVMEGYTDVIACHLAGFEGAVASLGTAFTAEHARTVERYASDGVVLMFDGDRAGRQAASRAMRELINSRLAVRIALVADGDDDAKDPADIVLPRPGEDEELVVERRARFAEVIEAAEDDLTVWFRLLRQRLDFTQPVNVEAAARECATLLQLVEQPVRQAALTEQMARHLAVPTPALERMLRGSNRPQRAQPVADEDARARPVEPPSLLERTERELLACVLARPDLLVGLDLDDEAPLQAPKLRQLFEWSADGLALGRDTGPQLFRYLFARAAEQPELQDLLADAHDRGCKMPAPDEVLAGLVAGRRRVVGRSMQRDLRQRIQQAIAAGDQATAAELQRHLLERMRRAMPRPQLDAEHTDASSAGAQKPAGDVPSFGNPTAAAADDVDAPGSGPDPGDPDPGDPDFGGPDPGGPDPGGPGDGADHASAT